MTDQPLSKPPSDKPAGMRFQERDGEIFWAIYEYDGVLARRHIKQMFWPDATDRAMEQRLSLLHQNGYLEWPSGEHKTKPIPEPICWLSWKAALWIAGQKGVVIEPPQKINETQLRGLDRRLRESGVRWTREPRWGQMKHDLAIVDFRLAVEKAWRELPELTLENWISEGGFLSQMDVVEYNVADRNGELRREKKGVRPDSYFVILDKKRQQQGLPARARFLLEMDMTTHDNASFGREKIIAGLAYLKSPAYKARFGDNSGRWLVVTTGEVRLKHLMHEARQVTNPLVFLFTTLDQLGTSNVLTTPIWRQLEKREPIALLV